MTAPAPDNPAPGLEYPLSDLGEQERAVYSVLAASGGRVVSRTELARRAGLGQLSERRADSLLVGLRRVLGPHAIRNVRRRGWILVTG